MKKILFIIALTCFFIIQFPYQVQAVIYFKTCLTGGTSSCLDSIDGVKLADKYKAFVLFDNNDATYPNQVFTYILDADSAASESVPNVISPDSNAGDKRWILQKSGIIKNSISDLSDVSGIGSDAQILISDGTTLTPKTISGDITVTNTGVTTVASATSDFDVTDILKVNDIGAFPVQEIGRKTKDESIIETFQSGHGWAVSYGNCTIADDTSDYVVGVQSLKITKTGTGICIVESPVFSAIDIQNDYLKILWKADDFSAINNETFTVDITADAWVTVSDYIFEYALQERVAEDKDGKWLNSMVTFATNTSTATDETAVTQIRITTTMADGQVLWVNSISSVPELTKGLVVLTFDHGTISDLKAAKYMSQHGFPGTSFISEAEITAGTDIYYGTRLTIAEMLLMQERYFWEFADHTRNHPDFKTASDSVVEWTEYVYNKTWMQSKGFTSGSEVTAYPGGDFTEDIKTITRKYFMAARTTETPSDTAGYKRVIKPLPFADYYEIGSLSMNPNMTYALTTPIIDNTETYKGALILLFHKLVDTNPAVGFGEYCWDSSCHATDNFQAIIDYIATKNLDVVTFGDLIRQMPNRDNINDDQILETHLKAVNTAADEECLTYESTTGDFEWQACSSAAGDNVSIDSVAVVDPDFVSTGDIDFVDTANTITANVKADSVALTTDTTGNYTASIADAGNSTITVVNGVSEGGAVTLDAVDLNCTDCIGTAEIADSYLLNSGDIGTGVFDFGGATSIEIVNGAAPTVANAGEIVLDTTADQFIYYGAAERVLSYERPHCAFIESLAAADDDIPIAMFNYPVTIVSVGVHCKGTCTTTAQISLEDRSGNAMTHDVPTVSTGTDNTTYVAVTAANQLVAGEGLRFDVDNAVSPETDTYSICFSYTIDRQ